MHKPLKYEYLRHAISFPFIWGMLIPIAITDLLFEIYHRVCFPLYGLPLVKRSDYIRILDRAKLPYLTWQERIGCAYCGYVNGWFHYASVIAGITEGYWCAIAHIEGRGYIPTEHEKSFAKYGVEAPIRRRHSSPKGPYQKAKE